MTEHSEGEALRLSWRQTFPDAEADYSAEADIGAVGRIVLQREGPAKGLWFWCMSAEVGSADERSGTANSPRGAARIVEAIWFGSNAYAAAKAR